ncbi:MAG TPA: hypothetical protein VF586_21535 [Pyrinomonadaceae bacterium]|jgi:hypothetical protein
MGLTLPKPPGRGPEIIQTALSGIIDRSVTTDEMALGGSERLDLSAPHKIFFVGLRDVAERRVLPAATQTGWRYIILRGDSPLAAAELGVDATAGGGEGDDDGLEFSQFNRGPYVINTVAGVELAASLDAVRNDDYELRLLKIPALYIIALWLHAEADGKDIIIPLPPTRPELKPFDSYTEQQFASIIHDAALRKQDFEDNDTGEGRS